jgi:WD40 repeat protein
LDPYKVWLGIPDGPRPPHHYDLLGLHLYESEASVIRHAADERTRIVRPRCLKYREIGTNLLNQIAKARVCLTDDGRKSDYDAKLKERLTAVAEIEKGKATAHLVAKDVRLPEDLLATPRAASPQLQHTLTGHSGAVTAVAFGKYSRYLASAGRDGTVRIWDLHTGRSRCAKEDSDYVSTRLKLTIVQKTFTVPVTCVAYSPDGKLLASGCYDGKVKLWDAESAELRRVLAVDSLDSHRTPVTGIVFRGDAATLVSASPHNAVRVWNVSSGELFRRVANPAKSVVFSPDGRYLASSDGIWDFTEDKLLYAFDDQDDEIGHVTSLAYSPDGLTLASGSLQCGVRLWNVNQVGDELPLVLSSEIGRHDGTIHSAAFSPDGATLATAAADGCINLWSASTGALLTTLQGHHGPVQMVAFSPDGLTLASGGNDGTIKIWSPRQETSSLQSFS